MFWNSVSLGKNFEQKWAEKLSNGENEIRFEKFLGGIES